MRVDQAESALIAAFKSQSLCVERPFGLLPCFPHGNRSDDLFEHSAAALGSQSMLTFGKDCCLGPCIASAFGYIVARLPTISLGAQLGPTMSEMLQQRARCLAENLIAAKLRIVFA